MSSLRAGIASGWNWLRRTPCKPLLLLTFLCLVVREQFPFSNFPMYSSFTNKTFYVYLADGTGQAIAAARSSGVRTAQLKKIYHRELLQELRRSGRPWEKPTEEEKTRAGERVLATLKNSKRVRQKGSTFPSVVRLYEVNISLREGRFEKQSLLIAEAR